MYFAFSVATMMAGAMTEAVYGMILLSELTVIKGVIGVRHQFRCSASTAPYGRAKGSANLGSDPKNPHTELIPSPPAQTTQS